MDDSPIPREHYLSLLRESRGHQFIKVITGIRRCGKSTLMEMFVDELRGSGVDEDRILSMNLDDAELMISTYTDLIDAVNSRIDGLDGAYLFFDEIQNIPEWERAISTFHLHKADIYITGSNSDMLSTELSTRLSGRCIEIRMHTLSFSEYVTFREIDDRDRLLEDYVRFGGFPAVSLSMDRMPRQTMDILDGIYNTVFVKDVQNRHEIRNNILMRDLCTHLMKNIGGRTSIRGIANYITSKGSKTQPQTIDQYIGFLEEALLFSRARRLDSKTKDYLRTSDKFYIGDVGVRNCLLPFHPDDLDGIVENIVYNELVYRHGDVAIYDVNGQEVDFIADPAGVPSYYQVSLSIMDGSTRDRVVRPLKAIDDNYPKTIITYERYPLDDIDGIRIVQLKDWLLE